MKTDSRLSFVSQVLSHCNKASQKLHAISKVTNYIDLDTKGYLIISFVTAQCNYCFISVNPIIVLIV